MQIKALLFAYCPVCEGVSVVLDDYDVLIELGCGETEQGCVFHSPETKMVEVACQKCKKNSAIARFPIIHDVAGCVDLIKIIESDKDKLKDAAVMLTLESRHAEYATSEHFLQSIKATGLRIREINQLLGAIKNYRFNTSTPQTYFHRGVYKTAD